MGPLSLADFIGLDVCLAIMNVMYDGFADSKISPMSAVKSAMWMLVGSAGRPEKAL